MIFYVSKPELVEIDLKSGLLFFSLGKVFIQAACISFLLTSYHTSFGINRNITISLKKKFLTLVDL